MQKTYFWIFFSFYMQTPQLSSLKIISSLFVYFNSNSLVFDYAFQMCRLW